MVRVIQFYLCSHPGRIPHFNHSERKHYSWLKVSLSISFHSPGLGTSLKSKLLELNLKSVGGKAPRKEVRYHGLHPGVSVGIKAQKVNRKTWKVLTFACSQECGPCILNRLHLLLV